MTVEMNTSIAAGNLSFLSNMTELFLSLHSHNEHALIFIVHAEGGAACKDQQGRSYESGFHYIPGPEPCTFCVCDNGNPKWCKAFICKFLEVCTV